MNAPLPRHSCGLSCGRLELGSIYQRPTETELDVYSDKHLASTAESCGSNGVDAHDGPYLPLRRRLLSRRREPVSESQRKARQGKARQSDTERS